MSAVPTLSFLSTNACERRTDETEAAEERFTSTVTVDVCSGFVVRLPLEQDPNALQNLLQCTYTSERYLNSKHTRISILHWCATRTKYIILCSRQRKTYEHRCHFSLT